MTERERVELPSLKAGSEGEVEIAGRQIVIPSEGAQQNQVVTTAQLAVTGGGGGMIAYLANSFIENPQWKSLLIVAAPSIGVILLKLWNFLEAETTAWWNSRRADKTRLDLLKKAKLGLIDAKAQLADIESDPYATADHKKLARDRVQSFERAVLDLNAAGIVVID